MNIFQSDNIWKRKMREEKAARNPPTEHEKWEAELRSNMLWLFGGVVVVVLLLAAVFLGAAELNLTTGVVIVVVALYSLMSVKQICDLWKNEPSRTGKEKKKLHKR